MVLKWEQWERNSIIGHKNISLLVCLRGLAAGRQIERSEIAGGCFSLGSKHLGTGGSLALELTKRSFPVHIVDSRLPLGCTKRQWQTELSEQRRSE